MKEDKDILYSIIKNTDSQFLVELDKLKDFKTIEVIELLPNQLWVAQRVGHGNYDELLFLTFYSSKTDYTNIKTDPLFLIQGYSDLKEGRHTYFPAEGYLFYMDSKRMKTALDYCEKYFDMD